MNKVIEVDLLDKPIKEITKEKAHQEGVLHRAFSVVLYKGNEILIQKRSDDKYHCGGLWTNTCCSHPRWGETTEEAVKRRLMEEMGISCETQEIFSFTYYYEFKNELKEFEYDHVFIGEYNQEFTINKEEVEEAKWIDINELLAWMKNKPFEFTPWFIIIMPKILDYLNKRS
ncbi:MAG: isopentenyl-diphosphate delta-isomerase [Bacillota bacterium]|jgi:isopentenyl-diphosphate delta-isomerase|nr:isopentenyl-diphosphate delta-isomerase [Bacillota bacterium]